MDCEKFESALIDELYGELDELTSAAAKRHIAGCARCAALISGFRATRRVAVLPKVEPPEGLEQRILAATTSAKQVSPVGWRLARVVSLAGSWAMRPQTAMAAVFLVMIGTSVLLLRGKSSRAPASAEMTVTEEGTPAPAAAPSATPTPESMAVPLRSAVALARTPEKPTAASPASTWAQPPGADLIADDPRQKGTSKPSAAKAMDGVGSLAQNAAPSRGGSGPGAAAGPAPARRSVSQPMAETESAPLAPPPPTDSNVGAELSAARAARDAAASQGGSCPSASQFDEVARRATGTPVAWDALFEGALCYESAGDLNSARARLNALLGVDSYRVRAQGELDRLDQQQQAARSAGAGAPRRAAPKAAPRPAASPPAGTESF